MSAVLEQLSGELSKTPTDQDLLRRFAERCLDAGELGRLRTGLEPVLAGLSGPMAVRPVAETLARTLLEAALRLEKRSAREAHELYLRAARVLATAANDRIGAARALASAWRMVPDERVAVASQALFQGTNEPPDYTLVALAEVGDSNQQTAALRKLAAGALEKRRLDDAELLFGRLDALHARDPDVVAGREVIATLRKRADERITTLTGELARATTRGERGMVQRLIGETLRAAGRLEAAKEAFAMALELGDEASLRPLETLHRELGQLDALSATLSRIAGPGTDASIGIKKKLFLVLDELGRGDEAQRILAAPAKLGIARERLDEMRVLAESKAEADPIESALALEEWAAAAGTHDDRDDKLPALEKAARLAARGREGDAPTQLEERLWRKVRALDPQSRGAVDFYREFYQRHPEPRRAYANLAQLHAITTDSAQRRELATEMATIAEASLGNLDKAIEAWRLVERDVVEVGDEGREARLMVWSELRRLYAAAGRWHAYVDLLDRWVDVTTDAAEKVEILFDAVEVYQDPARLPMPAMVLQTYQRIVALVPSHPVALDRLAVGLAEREQWADLLKVLAQKVELTTDPAELVALFHQIADLYLDHVRSDSQAVLVLERLLELDPDDLAVVRRLRELYRRRHDAERTFAALNRELELTPQDAAPDERVAILEALADTAQNEFLQPERAVDFHRQILELEPGREKSLEALSALHAEQEDWPAYTKVLEQRVQEAKTKAAKLPLLLELGETVLTRLGEVERAEQIFQTIAESSPTSAPARRFLQRIFVTRRKWDDLARLYTRATKASGSAGARWKDYVALLKDSVKNEQDSTLIVSIHVEIARVLETELDDRKNAAEHIELALREDEDQVGLARKMLELLGDDALGPRKLSALTVLARHAVDLNERYQAWVQIAQIHRRAKDPVSATDAWGKALVLGAELGLTEALPHLEEDAGATGRWENAYSAIDEALGRLPAVTTPEQAAATGNQTPSGLLQPAHKAARTAFHRSLGNIARTRLLKVDEAIRHFRWVLQLQPGDVFALEELEKLYYSHSDFNGLEEIYRARIESAKTTAERLAPMRALARLFDDVMLDPERAAAVHQDILHVAPDDRESFDALVKAHEAAESWGELAATIEGGLTRVRDVATRQALQARLAELCADRLGDPLAAIEHCRDVVERAAPPEGAVDGQRRPEGLAAGDPLSRVVALLERYAAEPIVGNDAGPVLELAYRKLGRLTELAAMLEARVATASASELPAVVDEILMLIGGVQAAPDKAYELLVRRFEAVPDDPDTWQELERAAGLTNAWEELAIVWRAVLERDELPMSASAKPSLRLRLADVYHRRMIELEEAIVETERALSETHDEDEKLEALEVLEILFKKTADLDSFVRVKLEASRRVLSRTSRRQKVIEAAYALAGALGRPDDAIAVLEPLWLDEPGDVEVADQILNLTERVGNPQRTDAVFTDAIDSAKTPERRDALRYRRALARRDRLGQWEVAISELIGLVESPGAGKDARRALLDVSRAQESEGQRDVILEVLVDYYRRANDQEGLINTLVVQAEFTPAGAERATVLRAAAIECLPYIDEAPQHAEEAHQAFDLYGQALIELPSDLEALDAMRQIASQIGLWPELAELLLMAVETNLLDSSDEADTSRGVPEGVRALLREEARIAEDELGDERRAIGSLTRELDLADAAHEQDVQDTLTSLARLYERVGDSDARRDALARIATIEPDPILRAEVLEELALLELDVGRTDEAIAGLESGLEELGLAPRDKARATRQRILATLENVLRGAQRHPELVDLLVQAAALEDAATEKRELLHRAAECATEDLGDKNRAVFLYEQLVQADATDEVAVARLVELHQEAGRWSDAILALGRQKALAIGAGAAAEARSIAFRVGQIQADHSDQPGHVDAALATFAEVLEGDPGHGGALAALSKIESQHPSAGTRVRALLAKAHRTRGDHAQLASVLEKVATFDAPPPALLAELADLWKGPLGNPARAWPHVARGYALDPLGVDGGLCRLHLFDLTHVEGRAPTASDGNRLVLALTDVASGIANVDERRARKEEDLRELGAIGVEAPEIVPAWRSLLQEDPKDLAVLALFEAWGREGGELGLLAEALEHRAASLPEGDRTAVELELAATLAQVPGREVEALRVWRGVLAREPDQVAAFDGLTGLMAQLGRYDERATLLAERITRETGVRADELRFALAQTRWSDLQDGAGSVDILTDLTIEPATAAPESIELLEAIWSEGSERPRVHRLLEPIYRAHEDWDKLVALYTSTLEQDDHELQVECLTKLAELENVRLDKPDAAFTTLLALVERLDDGSPDWPRHLGSLEALAGRIDKWDELVDRLEAMVALGRGGGVLMARLGRIHEIERSDPERAAYFYGFAFEHDAADLASRDALTQLLEAAERWDDLARHYLAAADRNETTERHTLRLLAATVLDSKVEDARRALDVLEAIAADAARSTGTDGVEDPAFAQAQERIAELLERTNDHAALHRHYRRWLELAPSDEVAIDVQVRLGRSLIRFPQTAREGLTELEEVLRTVPSRRDVVPALWSMIVACERAEQAAARGSAVVGALRNPADAASLIDTQYAEATADAARILESVVGESAPPTTLAGIVQAQLRVLPAGAERQATLIRLAGLMGELDAPERAFAYLAEALQGDLQNGVIEAQLEAIAAEHNYWEALAGLYEECSAHEDERIGARYVLKVANILEKNLGQAEEASSWYERHLAAVPGSRDAVEPLVTFYKESGDAASEARVLEAWIAISATREELPGLRMRLGILRMDQLGDVQGAIDALEGCLPDSAADAEFVRRLERLYIRGEHFPALVELYRAALQHAQSDKSRLEILAKMAQVYETRLDDATSARDTSRRMLAVEPLNRFALTTLERIERGANDWDAVDEILAKKLEATPAEAARVRILIDRADVAMAQRSKPEEAIEHLLAADKLWGTGPGPDELLKGLESLLRAEPMVRRRAARALEKRYRSRQAWQPLINGLLVELVVTPDAGERFALATQAAQIAVERLNDRGLALRVLLAALRQAPEAPDLRALVERAARDANDFAAVLRTGDDMLRRGVAESALVGFALWFGAIEQQYGDRTRAIRVFERVLDVEPGNAEAGDALAGLYRDRGDFAALRGIYNQRLAVEGPELRPVLELDLALHLAEHDGPEQTMAAIQALLTQHPEDPRLRATLLARVSDPVAGATATKVLAAQMREDGRWGELVKLFEARAEKATDATERSRLWRDAAGVLEAHVGDRVAAVKALANAAEAVPSELSTWRELRALAEQLPAWDELARALRVGTTTADADVAAELALWLATVEDKELGLGPDVALATLRKTLANAADNLPLREAIARLELAKGDAAQAEEEIAIITDLLEDDVAAQGWWRALRTLAEAQQDETRMVAANEALLERDPQDHEAAEHLGAIYRRAQRWEDLVELLFLRIQAASDEPQRAAQHWSEVALIRTGPLGDTDGAIEAWREAWTLDPALPEATRKVAQSATERGEWRELGEIWERHADAVAAPAEKAAAYFELGRVSDDRLRDPNAAVTAYELAIGADTNETTTLQAINALIALLGRTRRYAELAATLGRKAQVVKGAERSMVLVQAAAVQLDQLRNPAKARPLLDDVLAKDGDHLEGRLLLARLHVREGRPVEAAATLRDLAQRTEGKRRLRLLMDLARLYANEVGDLEAATPVVEEALAIDPMAPGLDGVATDVLTRNKDWKRLHEVLLLLFNGSKGTDKADRALQIARLYAGPLRDPGQLGHWLDQAAQADPGRVLRPDAKQLDVDRMLMLGQDEDAEALLSDVVRYLEEQRAAEEITERSHQLGLLREKLGDLDGALAAFARSHEIDGKNVRRLLDYGRVLIAAGRWTEALSVHQGLLMQRQALTDEGERLVVLERLALASWEAGQLDRARAYLNKLLAEKADHAAGLALRTRFGG